METPVNKKDGWKSSWLLWVTRKFSLYLAWLLAAFFIGLVLSDLLYKELSMH